MSYVQVPPDSTGKKIATVENGAGEQVQVIAIDSTTTKTIGENITSSDIGLVTNTVIHGKTTAGGGSYVDVKVSPSGALVADVTGSEVTITALPLPTDAATETTLAAILSLQDQVKSLADGIQYLANAISANMPRLDVANRQAVNVETGAIAISSGTLSNISQVGGQYSSFMAQDIPTTIYDNIKVS